MLVAIHGHGVCRLERAMSGRDMPGALDCTPDGTTVAQRGSREHDGWQVKPQELRARNPHNNG